MSNVATAFLQAELMDDCDEMETEDAREQRALGAFAFLFSPEDTMVECQDCKKATSLDLAIPSETICAFRCEKCDGKKLRSETNPRNFSVVALDKAVEEDIQITKEHREVTRLCLGEYAT